jgi:hypothetical protein
MDANRLGRAQQQWARFRCGWFVALGMCLCLQSVAVGALLGAPQSYEVDGSPVRVVVANHGGQDGLDLVVCSDDGDKGPSVSLLASGTFSTQRRITLDPARFIAHTVAAGDFNGDGNGDFAVAVSVVDVSPVRTGVLVYLSTGSGTFGSPQLYTLAGVYPECLEVGDVTGDGIADLVVCHSTGDTRGGGLISVLPGGAGGAFGSERTINVGSLPARAVVADVDGDNAVDVLIADPVERQIAVLYGNHRSTVFDPPVKVGAVDTPTALSTVRTGAGALLGVAAAGGTTGTILLFRQTSPRTFLSPVVTTSGNVMADLGSGDFDGDGRGDLVTLDQAGLHLTLWAGNGDGSFSLREGVTLTDAATRLAVADLDGNGRPDVALTSTQTDTVVVVANGVVAGGTSTETPTATTTPTATPESSPPTPVGTHPTPTPTLGPIHTVTPTPVIIPSAPGDANCDEYIDESDVEALIHRIFDENGCSGADVDGDGRVTSADLLLLLQMVWAQ